MANKIISISTEMPEYDGLVTLRFVDNNGTVKEIPDVDGVALLDDLHKTLGPNEQEGLPFLNAIRRFVDVRFGVKINILAARKLYEMLEKFAEDAASFFTKISGSDGTTPASTPVDSPGLSDTSVSDSSSGSEQKTPSSESLTNTPTMPFA